jgi:hypothetical protein
VSPRRSYAFSRCPQRGVRYSEIMARGAFYLPTLVRFISTFKSRLSRISGYACSSRRFLLQNYPAPLVGKWQDDNKRLNGLGVDRGYRLVGWGNDVSWDGDHDIHVDT